MKEPNIKIGIIEGEKKVKFYLPKEGYIKVKNDILTLLPGTYEINAAGDKITISQVENKKYTLELKTEDLIISLKDDKEKIKIFDVKIGRQFHWERYQQHEFYGDIVVKYSINKGFTVINVVPVEQYLLSVISSEMSATANIEYLKAHTVISRSWAIRRVFGEEPITDYENIEKNRIIKWYGQKGHTEFDICNDDHCQRYHGFSKITDVAKQAVKETKGEVLMYDNKICNTVFYKACGGITEFYSNSWEEKNFEYLKPVWDGIPERTLPDLTKEENVKQFIDSTPEVFCNTKVEEIKEYLTYFDKETTDFFRWSVKYDIMYLSELI
ncbi:MAG: SpoIID/LytB domain-containing protein, partial [Endomicrobia bacterium]|nr:SpoIID/LytB domain-containing protein [Endomicrobiia bacterium]